MATLAMPHQQPLSQVSTLDSGFRYAWAIQQVSGTADEAVSSELGEDLHARKHKRSSVRANQSAAARAI